MVSERIKHLSRQDKLWELYLHTLCGYHANTGANGYKTSKLETSALTAAESALETWEKKYG